MYHIHGMRLLKRSIREEKINQILDSNLRPPYVNLSQLKNNFLKYYVSLLPLRHVYILRMYDDRMITIVRY